MNESEAIALLYNAARNAKLTAEDHQKILAAAQLLLKGVEQGKETKEPTDKDSKK